MRNGGVLKTRLSGFQRQTELTEGNQRVDLCEKQSIEFVDHKRDLSDVMDAIRIACRDYGDLHHFG
jgi:hypothetical protein